MASRHKSLSRKRERITSMNAHCRERERRFSKFSAFRFLFSFILLSQASIYSFVTYMQEESVQQRRPSCSNDGVGGSEECASAAPVENPVVGPSLEHNVTADVAASEEGNTAAITGSPAAAPTSVDDVTASSPAIDIASIMASLSDLGQEIAPADGIRVASYIPPRPDEPVSSFYNVVDTTHVWGQYPAPADLARMTRDLLQLRTESCVRDPHMQQLYQAIASTLGCGRHLLPQVQRSKLFDDFGNIADPQVLFEWIMRDEVRRRDDMTGKADRSLPLPVYDSNHGFHDSDIVAYSNETLLEETWGKPQLSTSEDLLARAASSSGSAACPPESVHAKGGLTWMERALVDKAPYETLSEYYPYRERVTSASGKFSAARTRTEIASYPRLGGAEREGFVDAVKHRIATSSSHS
jgi:hypothetical protein